MDEKICLRFFMTADRFDSQKVDHVTRGCESHRSAQELSFEWLHCILMDKENSYALTDAVLIFGRKNI